MKRILVIFTGGTIGSQQYGNVINTEGTAGYRLLSAYETARGSVDVHFEARQTMQILSENMTPGRWGELAAAVLGVDLNAYDGIVVTHGSDTLAFTAAMLGLTAGHLPLPIVLVAANYPLEDPRSNGLANFEAAVQFITKTALPGVYVTYQNNKGEMPVYLGTRVIEARPFDDQFETPYGTPLGWMKNGSFVLEQRPWNPPEALLRAARGEAIKPAERGFSSGIVYIRPYPGLDYHLYQWSGRKKPDAILHGVYHSATVSSARDAAYESSFASFAAYCAAEKIPLYLAPDKDQEAARYASTPLAGAGDGVRRLEHMAVEAALAKLMIAYGSLRGAENDERRNAYLNSDIFFEHVKGGAW